MLNDILKYVSKATKKSLETINLSILISNPYDIVNEQIIEIAPNIKNLKIVTPNVSKFLNLEEILYIEYGIALQVTNNKKKALTNSDVILNFDFDENTINQYEINNSATIININHKIKIHKINFYGHIINNYKIEYAEEIMQSFENDKITNKKDFKSNILYESLIYRKDTYKNIKKQLIQDKVRLTSTY